jgi:hypothetical protein
MCSGLMARCGYSGLVVASLSLQINHLCCNSIVRWQKRIRNEETGGSNPLSSTILSNHLAHYRNDTSKSSTAACRRLHELAHQRRNLACFGIRGRHIFASSPNESSQTQRSLCFSSVP